MNDPVAPLLPFSRRSLIAGGAASMLLPTLARAAESKPNVCTISLQDGRIWIAASIKGGKPLLFIIDTGASYNMIRPEIASQLALPISNVRSSVGIGRDSVTGEFVTARDFLLGGTVRLPQVQFTTNNFGKDFHSDCAGILAAGLFTAFDTDIDVEHSQLRIYQGGRPNREGLIALPSRITSSDSINISRKVVVNATLDGRQYRLLMDTGAPGGVLLFAHASYSSGIFAAERPYALELSEGIGGPASKLTRVVRMQSLQIGPITVEHPIVHAMNPDANDHIGDHDGLIGLGILQSFLLSTDAKSGTLWVAKNNLPLRQPHYRVSGVWLNKTKDGGASVSDVGGASPAAQAGLRVGDVLEEPKTFEDAIRTVNGAEGKEILLKVRRQAEVKTISYTLRPWF